MWHSVAMDAALGVTAFVVFGIVVWWMSRGPTQSSVLVTSRDEEGTAQMEPPIRHAADGRRLSPERADALAPLSILLVEDDDDSRGMLAATLECDGAHVVAVSSAADALRTLHTHHADVLLSDLRLPERDGFSLIRDVRMQPDPAIAGLPAASITASRRVEDRCRALAAGFQLHIEKPVDPDDLVAAMRTLAAICDS